MYTLEDLKNEVLTMAAQGYYRCEIRKKMIANHGRWIQMRRWGVDAKSLLQQALQMAGQEVDLPTKRQVGLY